MHIECWVLSTVLIKSSDQSKIIFSAHLASVGVGDVWLYAFIFNDIEESICHEATVAAVISIFCWTIHQVLRTEGHKDACSFLELPLQSASCTEGPTRATRTLLDKSKSHLGWMLRWLVHQEGCFGTTPAFWPLTLGQNPSSPGKGVARRWPSQIWKHHCRDQTAQWCRSAC